MYIYIYIDIYIYIYIVLVLGHRASPPQTRPPETALAVELLFDQLPDDREERTLEPDMCWFVQCRKPHMRLVGAECGRVI